MYLKHPQQSDLHRRELSDGVPLLLSKIVQYAPRLVCFVGLGIADIVRVALAAVSECFVQDICTCGLIPRRRV